MTTPAWHVWTPDAPTPRDRLDRWLADPPPWRRPPAPAAEPRQPPPWSDTRRAEKYIATGGADQLDRVNVALHLRRPLLVTGVPGIGKSTLAWHLGHRLGLGPPLVWPIGSRTTLQDGLYHYDATSHLADIRDSGGRPLADFIRLGPLGTALLPTELPRVLLIDEVDKASYDLPNDLLHTFEEATFEIPELAEQAEARVSPHDRQGPERVTVRDGKVTAHHHPVVVLTSNQEREFPEAFLRRCVPLDLGLPEDPEVLADIARSWFGEGTPESAAIADFLRAGYDGEAVDVILQALQMERHHGAPRAAIAGALRRTTS